MVRRTIRSLAALLSLLAVAATEAGASLSVSAGAAVIRKVPKISGGGHLCSFCRTHQVAAAIRLSKQQRRPAFPDASSSTISTGNSEASISASFAASALRSQRVANRGTIAAPKDHGDDNDNYDDGEHGRLSESPPSKRDIVVSASIDLPFSAEVAFDAFSDLPRQPSWSSWLRSVRYVDENDLDAVPICEDSGMPLRETRWTMGYRGLRFSWNAVSTMLDRPWRIDWESTSGLKNYGTVRFIELEVEKEEARRTVMTLSMKFRVPRIMARMLRRSDAVATFMEDKMLRGTLEQFRDVVMAEDLGGCGRASPGALRSSS